MSLVATRKAAVLVASTVALFSLAACGTSAQSTNAAPAGSQGGSQAASSAKPAADKDTIVIAAVPSESSQSLKDQYGSIVKLLEKETGKKVTYQDATDYSAVIEGQRAGKIDIALYGPFSYKIAKDSGVPIEPIGTGVNKKGDKPGYYSTAWVKTGSEIKDLKGMKGKNVCFVDPASTSGNLVPTFGLKKAGLDVAKDLKQVFAGAHDASMISTSTGQCDAGFAQDSMVPTLISKNQLKEGQLTQIWKSDLIPGSPIAMNTQTLSPDLQSKIKKAIQEKGNVDELKKLGLCDGDTCKMAGDAKWGYLPVDDKSFDPIREICKETNAPACQAKK